MSEQTGSLFLVFFVRLASQSLKRPWHSVTSEEEFVSHSALGGDFSCGRILEDSHVRWFIASYFDFLVMQLPILPPL
jgi:hypothetical protein